MCGSVDYLHKLFTQAGFLPSNPDRAAVLLWRCIASGSAHAEISKFLGLRTVRCVILFRHFSITFTLEGTRRSQFRNLLSLPIEQAKSFFQFLNKSCYYG